MISERALKEMAQVGAKLANAEQLRELLEVPVTRPSADQTQKHSPREPSRGLRLATNRDGGAFWPRLGQPAELSDGRASLGTGVSV